jgi:hypothetical protein
MDFIKEFLDGIGKEATIRSAKAEIGKRYNIGLSGKWTAREILELHRVLRQLPNALVKNNSNLLSIWREDRIANAPSWAPGHSMYNPNRPKFGKYRGALVIFDKGVYDNSGKFDRVQFEKSILHDLAHSFGIARFDPVFGKPPFITEYAKREPKEDFAESFAEYFLHPSLLKERTPEKSEVIKMFLARSR